MTVKHCQVSLPGLTPVGHRTLCSVSRASGSPVAAAEALSVTGITLLRYLSAFLGASCFQTSFPCLGCSLWFLALCCLVPSGPACLKINPNPLLALLLEVQEAFFAQGAALPNKKSCSEPSKRCREPVSSFLPRVQTWAKGVQGLSSTHHAELQ